MNKNQQLNQDFAEAIINIYTYGSKTLDFYKEAQDKLGVNPSKDDYMGLAMVLQSEVTYLRMMVDGIGRVVKTYQEQQNQK